MSTIYTAPLVPVMTYANTFVDWFTTTNTMVVDFNNFTANAYAKNTGTLYLNEPSTALVVGNGVAQFGAQLQSSGPGSYVTVDNDLTINYGQLLISNANIISVIVNGASQWGNTIYANGSGEGLYVANSARIIGTANIIGNTYFASSIFVTGPVTLNVLTVLGNTAIDNTVFITGTTNVYNTINSTANVNAIWVNALDGFTGTLSTISGYANAGRISVTNDGQIGTQLIVGDSIFTANGNYANTLQANNVLFANVSYANTLQANVSTNTATANAIVGNIVTVNSSVTLANSIYANNITSNTNIKANIITANSTNSAVINVNSISSNLQFGNTSIISIANVTNTLNVNTGIAYINTAFANTITSGNVIATTANIATANISNAIINNSTVNTESVNIATITLANVTNTLNVNTGIAYINTEYVNSSTILTNLNANNEWANVITANNSIVTPLLNVTQYLIANVANSYLGNVYAGNLTVSGNLFLQLPTVYTSNNFILYQLEPGPPQFADFSINRGTSATPAQLQWYEINKQWQINNVTTNYFWPILTGEVLNDSITNHSSGNVATSTAVYSANLYTQSAYNFANSVNTYAYAAYASQNITASFANSAFTFANNVNTYAYAAYASQNITASFANSAYAQSNSAVANTIQTQIFANSVNTYAYAAYGFANTVSVYSSASYASQNITASFANSAYTAQNTTASFANGAFSRANNSVNSFTGTTGSITPTSGAVTFSSANGVTITGSGSTFTFSTPQDIRTTASPTFSALTLSNALSITNGGTGSTSAATALQNLTNPTSQQIGYIFYTSGPGGFGWMANNAANVGVTTLTGATSSIVNAQLALQDLYTIKATLASPAFTGNPTATTQATTDTSTKLATTAFVTAFANAGYILTHSITGKSGSATNLAGGTTPGQIPYQTAAGATSFTAAGTNSQVLIGGSAPSWASTGVGISITGSSGSAGYLTGGSSGSIPYQQSTGQSGWLGIGTQNQILSVSGSGLPAWINPSSISGVSSATNLAGGSASVIPYQTAAGSTSFIGAPSTASTYLQWNGTGFTWAAISGTASQATNIANGGVGQIPYQTGAGSTSFISQGASNQVLIGNGASAPSWTSTPTFTGLTVSGALSGMTSLAMTGGGGSITNVTSLSMNGTLSGASSISSTGNITAYSGSDKKWKENIRDIVGALDIVDTVGGKLFDWTDEYIQQNGGADNYLMQKSDFGVIAQDLLTIFPVATRTRFDGSLAVDYQKLVAVAFAAINELRAEVKELKKSK